MNVAEEIAPNTGWEDAMARSLVYAFLSRGLAYPDPVQLGVLRERIVPDMIELELQGEIGEVFREVLPRLSMPLDSLRAAHTSIFSLTVSADCPDYETAYLSRDVFQQAHVMADVSGFYSAHGLVIGQHYQRPDHIATELEFMGFLARKEAYAIERSGEEHRAIARHSQEAFVRDHLAAWAPALGARIEASDAAGDSPYGWLGRMLAVWLSEDCAYLGVTPAMTVDGPMLEWPEPDDGACGGEEMECPVTSGVPLSDRA